MPQSVLPAVLCVDVEPDRRLTDRDDRSRPPGANAFLQLLPKLRDQMSATEGADAQITWCLRMDAQIRDTYGSATWLAEAYEREFDAMRAAGDAFGLHAHSWRWQDDVWVADHGDDSWTAECVQMSLHAFRAVFGHDALVYRHGDGFMSNAIAAQIDAAGVRIDHTLEPGREARPRLSASEQGTGMLPDLRSIPTYAYRPSGSDFRVPDPSRRSGTLFAPLTTGVVVSMEQRNGRRLPTAQRVVLQLWADPHGFARGLRATLRDPHLTHLAFVLRTDIGLLPGELAKVERNIDEIRRQLEGVEYRWCTAIDAAERIESGNSRFAPARHDTVDDGVDGRAAHWLDGTEDLGYQVHAEAEAVEALMDDAQSLAGRLRTLGITTVEGSAPARAEPPPVRWVDEPATVRCPVCGEQGPGRRVVMGRWGHEEIGVVRCGSCGALVPERVLSSTMDMPDELIDAYLEFTAGIDSTLTTLSRVEKRRGLRFLDVGCGFGFALDLTRFAWDWHGVGVDPSNSARLGSEQLGVDIRSGELDASTDLGDEPFDIALASEALEHVAEPLTFMQEIHARLAPDGLVVLSTPNADFIKPESSQRDVAAAMGLGGHAFLATRKGLHRLLERAGFEGIDVIDDGQTLRVIASPTSAGLDRCGLEPAALDLDLLARYCDERATTAPDGSSLRLGMSARAVMYALHAGDFAAAEAAYPRLRQALLDRHGIDADAPHATVELAVDPLPSVVAGTHYSAGFLELVPRDNPQQAAEQFAAAAIAANSAASRGRDPGIVWLQLRALGHEALAHARSRPERAPDVLIRLRNATREFIGADAPEVDELCAQVFRELVARGHFEEADAVRMLVTLPEAWIRDEIADGRVALETVFSLGMLGLHRGRPAEALAYFGLCARLADHAATPTAKELAKTARAHEALALEQLTSPEPGPPATVTRREIPAASERGAPPAAPSNSTTALGVSVVMPLFNGRAFLREAITSVAAQTALPNELIVVDDGSSDGGSLLLDDVGAPFPIRLLQQSRAGQSAARNAGVAVAEGELIAFLDQDDTWHPEHLAELTKPFSDDPAVGWVYCDFDEIDDEGRTVTRSFLQEHRIPHPRNTLAACLSDDLMVIPSASVVRRSMFESVGGFDVLLHGFEDDDLYVRAFRAGWHLAFVPKSLTRFRVHGTSSSAEGRFAESRRYFSQKLCETVADDRRLNRIYSRDVIAPRFLRAALNDYVRMVSDRQWSAARQVWRDMRYFASFHRDRTSLRWKLAMLRNPRLARLLLRFNAFMPIRPRRLRDPVLRLR